MNYKHEISLLAHKFRDDNFTCEDDSGNDLIGDSDFVPPCIKCELSEIIPELGKSYCQVFASICNKEADENN